ncbi:MAG: hypothetical protein KatS3mg103_0779 [Phycisphaerales bacterium]|nr:MAG: hypothetical protein KatS3mg103_0779 [Phycisphaerales bacterium]
MVCVLLGLGLDALVGSGPLFLLVGLVVGVVGGFVAFVRTGLRPEQGRAAPPVAPAGPFPGRCTGCAVRRAFFRPAR